MILPKALVKITAPLTAIALALVFFNVVTNSAGDGLVLVFSTQILGPLEFWLDLIFIGIVIVLNVLSLLMEYM